MTPPSESSGQLLTSWWWVGAGGFAVTLRVDVRVGVSASRHTQQRLRADAAQVHFVDVRHHAGHHGLVEQSRTCNLETDGVRRPWLAGLGPPLPLPLPRPAPPTAGCCFLMFYLSQVEERGLPLQRRHKVPRYGQLLGCKAFWEVLQRRGQPALPVLGKVADI